VVVEGHTHDLYDLSSPGQGLRIGFERAERVAVALISFGLDPSRLTLASRGPLGPLASNDLPAGQARNERVEVHIRPSEPSGIPR
jgi:outer membrane protein OmpA-like peptidoglycan-associated protein